MLKYILFAAFTLTLFILFSAFPFLYSRTIKPGARERVYRKACYIFNFSIAITGVVIVYIILIFRYPENLFDPVGSFFSAIVSSLTLAWMQTGIISGFCTDHICTKFRELGWDGAVSNDPEIERIYNRLKESEYSDDKFYREIIIGFENGKGLNPWFKSSSVS